MNTNTSAKIVLYTPFETTQENGNNSVTSIVPSEYSSGSNRVSGLRTNFLTIEDDLDIQKPENDFYEMEETGNTDNIMLQENKKRESYTTVSILIGAVIGVGLGIFLSKFNVSPTVAQWIQLPGELFINALKCLVIPMVFFSISVSIADIVFVGKASVIGMRCAAFFMCSCVLSAVQGIGFAVLFRPLFTVASAITTTNTTPQFRFLCPNGNYMHSYENGTIDCSGKLLDSISSTFLLNDINNVFSTTSSSTATLSLTDQIIAILNLLVPVNITQAMASGALLSVIAFSLPFGVAVAQTLNKKKSTGLLDILRQLKTIFLLLINWVVCLTPIAIISLISGALASNSHQLQVLTQVGYLVLSFLSSIFCHVFLAVPLVMFVLTRHNPFKYMKAMIPAYIFALGCSSSLATLPVALSCINRSRQASRSLAQFVLSIGTSVNLNAAGLYYPIMIIFMAETAGLGSKIGVPEIIVLFIVSIIASTGTAPVPNAGLVMLTTVWKTVLPGEALPASFSFVVAADFFLDRMATIVNVNGNCMAVRIIADQVDESVEDEEDTDRTSIELV